MKLFLELFNSLTLVILGILVPILAVIIFLLEKLQ